MEKDQKPVSNKLIRRKEVQIKTGLGASSIYAMMKNGEFPQCLSLSERRVAWVESDVDKWINDTVNGARKEYEPVLIAATKVKKADTGEDQKSRELSTRDKIAVYAMQGMYASGAKDHAWIAEQAYRAADEMLNARGV